jgi:hypothetical protein
VLPDENQAREAARQINQALAQPISLVPGRSIQLFATGKWKGWLEARPFQPMPNKLVFFRHPGRSPAKIPGTNAVESAVATLPPGYELRVDGRVTVNGVNRPDLAFSATLSSGSHEPGIYWFTWYALPNPQTVDDGPKQNWEFQIHDTAGHDLFRTQAPQGLKNHWRRRYLGELNSVGAGHPIRQMLFEKPYADGDRSPTFVDLEMTMQPIGTGSRRLTE